MTAKKRTKNKTKQKNKSVFWRAIPYGEVGTCCFSRQTLRVWKERCYTFEHSTCHKQHILDIPQAQGGQIKYKRSKFEFQVKNDILVQLCPNIAMGYANTTKWFAGHLKFKFNWASCILSGKPQRRCVSPSSVRGHPASMWVAPQTCSSDISPISGDQNSVLPITRVKESSLKFPFCCPSFFLPAIPAGFTSKMTLRMICW